MNGTEASVHDSCTRTIDDVRYRVICLDRIREHHLKGFDGNYSITAQNAKTLEDPFFHAARGAYLTEPDNPRKIILYDEPEDDIKEDQKIKFEDSDQRFVFDPKTGKEVAVDTDGNEIATPVAGEAPLKKVKVAVK